MTLFFAPECYRDVLTLFVDTRRFSSIIDSRPIMDMKVMISSLNSENLGSRDGYFELFYRKVVHLS